MEKKDTQKKTMSVLVFLTLTLAMCSVAIIIGSIVPASRKFADVMFSTFAGGAIMLCGLIYYKLIKWTDRIPWW